MVFDMKPGVYFAQNTSNIDLSRSSSGGMFIALARYILKQGGVVFGAVFDESFNVIIKYTETDVSEMLGSKYVKSSVGTSFSDCKRFLDSGRVVLYTGTPCQIIGLKAYLKHDYENLYTMDVICHGSPRMDVWQRYLKSFSKPIKRVLFRDKSDGWERFRLTIQFTDGTQFSEYHQHNKYIRLFLDNKILNEPCYTCKCNKNSNADITVGDAWGAQTSFNRYNGVSCIIIHTNKGTALCNHLVGTIRFESSTPNYLQSSVGYIHNYTKPHDYKKIISSLLSPKIAVITIPGHNNVGNTLQSIALQAAIQDIVPTADVTNVNQKIEPNEFFKSHVSHTSRGLDESYDISIIGSDQIWSDEPFVEAWGVPFEDRFGIHTSPRKLVYGASFGKHILNFSGDSIKRIQHALNRFTYIGVREFSGTFILNRMFGVRNSSAVLDPTMLYDKEFYASLIGDNVNSSSNGIFKYVLDDTSEWDDVTESIASAFKTSVLPYNGTCEEFLYNMNHAKCVITDSYHGTVFSMIFNKPFMTLRNAHRGNDRFDDLVIRFKPIKTRIVQHITDINNNELLKTSPNVIQYIKWFRESSIKFLRSALYQF